MNFARGAKYQNSAIIHCQNQLNQYFHDQTNKKKIEEKEARWRMWMAGLEEEGGAGRAGGHGGGILKIVMLFMTLLYSYSGF